MSESLSSLLTKERPGAICSGHSCQKIYRERIALNFVFKKTRQWFVHDSSESLEKNERFAQRKRSFRRFLTFSRLNPSFTFLLTKNERFARKTDERIPNRVFTAMLLHQSRHKIKCDPSSGLLNHVWYVEHCAFQTWCIWFSLSLSLYLTLIHPPPPPLSSCPRIRIYSCRWVWGQNKLTQKRTVATLCMEK